MTCYHSISHQICIKRCSLNLSTYDTNCGDTVPHALCSFTALEAHVGALKESSLSEAVPAASKKGTDADGNNETDGKKRKAATQGSKGVEKLKKANIKGMAKLSNFFQKTETKAKS